MMHIHYFITRKASMNDAEFHRYWRETHGPIAAKIPQLHRYVQSHRIPAFGSNSPYDGEAEVLVDGLDAMAALRRSPEYLEGALADERNFIDLTRVEWMACWHSLGPWRFTPREMRWSLWEMAAHERCASLTPRLPSNKELLFQWIRYARKPLATSACRSSAPPPPA